MQKRKTMAVLCLRFLVVLTVSSHRLIMPPAEVKKLKEYTAFLVKE